MRSQCGAIASAALVAPASGSLRVTSAQKAALSPDNTRAPHWPRCSRAALQNASGSVCRSELLGRRGRGRGRRNYFFSLGGRGGRFLGGLWFILPLGRFRFVFFPG